VDDYDLAIIGCGPTGEKAAAQAAYFDKRVIIFECADDPGGAAVQTGTLPSKTLREAAMYLSGYRNRELYGVAVELNPDATIRTLLERTGAIRRGEATRMRDNLARHKVTYCKRLTITGSQAAIFVAQLTCAGEHMMQDAP
jgi:NAD(P) transhydrogenase